MTLNFNPEYLPQPKVNKHRAQSIAANDNNNRFLQPVDSNISYNMLSVHFDRVNITKVSEVHRKSTHHVFKDDNDYTSVSTPEKKVITYSTNGLMSEPTKAKIKKAIKYLNFVTDQKTFTNSTSSFKVNFKIAFVTLTLSSEQIHTDNQIKKLLINQLLVEVKKKYNISHYVWKCEKQANHNVHFHFLFDNFIPHTELRELWNRLQNKLGYVDRYTDRMSKMSFYDYKELFKNNKKYDDNSIRAAWAKGKATQWRFPNSVDIHSLQFINDIDSYLIKYMSKDEQNKGIEGRLWGCSNSLSNLTGGRDIMDSQLSDEIDRLITDSTTYDVKGDYYLIIFFDYETLERLNCVLLIKLLKDWLIEHFNIKQSTT